MDPISCPESSLHLTATFVHIHAVGSSHTLYITIFEASPHSPAHRVIGLDENSNFDQKADISICSLQFQGKKWKCILCRFWHQKTNREYLQSFSFKENIMNHDCECLSLSNTKTTYKSVFQDCTCETFFISKMHMHSSCYCSVESGICVPYHY